MIFRKEGQKPQVIQNTCPRRKSYKQQQEDAEQERKEAVDNEDYEMAAELRDRARSIQRQRERIVAN